MKHTTLQPEEYAVMRSSYIKHRLEAIESTLYVLRCAADGGSEPVEMSKAIGMVIDGVRDVQDLVIEMIEELQNVR